MLLISIDIIPDTNVIGALPMNKSWFNFNVCVCNILKMPLSHSKKLFEKTVEWKHFDQQINKTLKPNRQTIDELCAITAVGIAAQMLIKITHKESVIKFFSNEWSRLELPCNLATPLSCFMYVFFRCSLPSNGCLPSSTRTTHKHTSLTLQTRNAHIHGTYEAI